MAGNRSKRHLRATLAASECLWQSPCGTEVLFHNVSRPRGLPEPTQMGRCSLQTAIEGAHGHLLRVEVVGGSGGGWGVVWDGEAPSCGLQNSCSRCSPLRCPLTDSTSSLGTTSPVAWPAAPSSGASAASSSPFYASSEGTAPLPASLATSPIAPAVGPASPQAPGTTLTSDGPETASVDNGHAKPAAVMPSEVVPLALAPWLLLSVACAFHGSQRVIQEWSVRVAS